MRKFIPIAAFFLLPFAQAHAFEVTSVAFANGEAIPKVHACSRQGGKDLSIPIKFAEVPSGTAALAIIMDDPDAEPVAGHTWVHRVLTDISPDTTALEAKSRGDLKIGLTGRNDSGSRAYQGMCPPNGKHTYIIAGYALKEKIGKKLGSMTRKRFEKKYGKIILERSEFTGHFGG